MPKIKQMDKADRPREKMQNKGPKALKDEELLQVIIGSGIKGADVVKISRQIKKLIDLNGCEIKIDQLMIIRGISLATATKLVALFELASRKSNKEAAINSAQDAVALVPEMRDLKQEHLVALSLDGANRLIAKRVISVGTLNASLVHPREVFADAITDRAASLVIIHNHPSGNAEPSQSDTEITERIKQSGKLLGIQLQDHIIITKSAHHSLTEAGVL